MKFATLNINANLYLGYVAELIILVASQRQPGFSFQLITDLFLHWSVCLDGNPTGKYKGNDKSNKSME